MTDKPLIGAIHERVQKIEVTTDKTQDTGDAALDAALKDSGHAIVAKGENRTLSPTTTEQEDNTLAGQRKINLIWEYTQAVIALIVVTSTMVCGIFFASQGREVPTIMSVAFGTVVGFYFSRTNHAAIGGVGHKAESRYTGR